MSGIIFKDNAYGTITSTIGTGDSRSGMAINLTSGHGARFASAVGTDEHMILDLINTAGQIERIKVTAISTDAITANGAQLGTTAKAFAPGDRIECRWHTGAIAEMARLGNYNNHITLGGTINAITGTLVTGLRALIDGMEVTGKATGANTDAATLALTLDATTLGGSTTNTGAKDIIDEYGTNISGGMIAGVNHLCRFKYLASAGKWVLTNPARVSQLGRVCNLQAANNAANPNNQIDVTAGRVLVQTSTGATMLVDITGTLTCDINSAGPVADGRDQAGAFASGATVHFFFIWNGSTKALIASVTATPLVGPTALPTGYTHSQYLFSVVLNGTNLPVVYARGSKVYFETPRAAVTGATAIAETTLNLSSWLPSIANEVDLQPTFSMSFTTSGSVSVNFFVKTAQIFETVTLGGTSNIVGRGKVLAPVTGYLAYSVGLVGSPNSYSAVINLLAYKVPNGDS